MYNTFTGEYRILNSRINNMHESALDKSNKSSIGSLVMQAVKCRVFNAVAQAHVTRRVELVSSLPIAGHKAAFYFLVLS
jgi:hypothetical protein